MMEPKAPPAGYRVCEMPDGPFAAPLGPLFIREDGGGFAFRADDRHCNARRVVHGGMLLTFADQVLGLTVQRHLATLDLATVSLTCELVGAAIPGDLLEGCARILRVTRSIVFVQGAIECQGRVVLTASGIWKRLKPLPDGTASLG